jgi:hypothetical protein
MIVAMGLLASPTGFEDKTTRRPSSQPVVETRKDNGLNQGRSDGNRRK